MEMETSWEIEGRKQGLQEGLVLGHEQGQKQGLRQGMATMLEQQLISRFSNLSQESIDTIHKLSPDTLLKLGITLPSFMSPADLAAWLAEHSS